MRPGVRAVTPLTVVLMSLATYRLSLLVTADALTERPREWLLRRVADDGYLATLLGCAWCVSMWVGTAVVTSGWYYADRAWWAIPATILTASAVTGFLATYASPGD